MSVALTAAQSALPLKVGYVRLGTSGLKISKIVLGCMSYGNDAWSGGWTLKGDEALEHFGEAFKMGINTWDTANMYSNGDSEILVGQAIKKFKIPREELVILSKVWGLVAKVPDTHPSKLADPDNNGYVNLHGLSRKAIFASVRDSLKRMDIEYIDLYQCHRFDPETPISETMHALHDIVKLGLVRYIGMSSCYAYQFHEMQNYAIANNLTPFISMQHFHNAVYREEEREMVPTLKIFGTGSLPWSPLGRGYLTRPHDQQTSTRANSDRNYARFVGLGNPSEEAALRAINSEIESIAQERGYSMAQVALAWSLSQEFVSAPIIGTTNLASLKELVQACSIVLTKEEIERINKPYVPRGILGH